MVNRVKLLHVNLILRQFFKDLNICTRLLKFKLLEGFVNYVSDSIYMLGYLHMHVILGLSE